MTLQQLKYIITTAEKNKLTDAQQWAKLALVKEIAEEVWK